MVHKEDVLITVNEEFGILFTEVKRNCNLIVENNNYHPEMFFFSFFCYLRKTSKVE
jgi:hypothetical protein